MPADLPSLQHPRRVGAMKWLVALLGLVLVLVINVVGPGCGTILNHQGGAAPRPYGGLKINFAAMKQEPAILPAVLIDVPFSFVGDTLCLPSDLYHNDPPTNKTQGGIESVPPAESR